MLRHVNYRPWHALAEFVDNAVESFTTHVDALRDVNGRTANLTVRIDIERTHPPRICVRDNAAGISSTEYARAFRPAEIPPDRSGLAEFGMGMKSAACWFAPRWSVRTSALGEFVGRTVRFDIDKIVSDRIEELHVGEYSEEPGNHYTEIILEDVFHLPKAKTVTKLKTHLTDIYREFIRRSQLELYFNGDQLSYDEPKVLSAPHFKVPHGPVVQWRKEITFDLGGGLSVSGFAALRQRGDTARAGFSLFRRGRVIEGSGDEGYRPAYIFGASNSFRYQRLFGELHLAGFDVSHTKDGFRWDENEQPFLELLREYLDGGDLPLLAQAEGHRVLRSANRLKEAAAKAVTTTTGVMEERLPSVLPVVADGDVVDTPSVDVSTPGSLAAHDFEIVFRQMRWSIRVELTNDPSIGDWLLISDQPARPSAPRRITIAVGMAHPFMIRYAQTDSEDVEALLRVAAAIGLAEVLARDAGVSGAGTVRRNMNDILREALSEP